MNKNYFSIPSNILIIGASGGIGRALITELSEFDCSVGAHCNDNRLKIEATINELKPKILEHIIIKKNLDGKESAFETVDEFFNWKSSIDVVIILLGKISNPEHWRSLSEPDWNADLLLNLSIPFFIAQRTITYMIQQERGQIIFVSTESSLHGGGSTSIAYGVAKAGIECLVKRLAKDCAQYNIRVNGIRPGYIRSGFHERWKKITDEEREKRISLIPLKRAGRPDEIAKTIIFLISSWNSYMTGELISVSGGDYL